MRFEYFFKIYGDFNCLFLDEIQNVDGWHLFVNRLLRKKMKVVITGSNAKLLSGELATHLTGRNKEIALYPFSFTEFCKANELDVYYLNERNSECDFVVCKKNKVLQAIQVSYDISAEKTRKREVNGLLMAAKVTKCENLLLLTDHESEVIEQGGHRMKVQPVYEWCGEMGI